MERTLNSKRCNPHRKRRSIRELAHRFEGKVVVVESFAGTFTGCLVSAHLTFLRLRVFNPVIRRFVILRIPYAIIARIRLVRCRNCK